MEATCTSVQGNVLPALHEGGGVPPIAFTHIPLMSAGDVASGVETYAGSGTDNTQHIYLNGGNLCSFSARSNMIC